MDATPELTWSRIAAFVRQHTHDVRNHLNGLDLEAALLAEIVTDPEGRECVDRIRRQVRDVAGGMRTLSAKFAEPTVAPVDLLARDIFLIWQDQSTALTNPLKVQWIDELGDERVSVDANVVANAFRELLTNAAAFGSGEAVGALARSQDREVLFTLREPKKAPLDTADWGRKPFASTRRGGYGLGLWEVERGVKATGGAVRRRFDPAASELVTTFAFPAI